MNALICAIALISPHRAPNLVDKVVTKYQLYYTDRTEHCFAEVTKLGWTWVEDELIELKEVPMEMCWESTF